MSRFLSAHVDKLVRISIDRYTSPKW